MQLAVSKGDKRKLLFNQIIFTQDAPASDFEFVLKTKFFSNVKRWFITLVAKVALISLAREIGFAVSHTIRGIIIFPIKLD